MKNISKLENFINSNTEETKVVLSHGGNPVVLDAAYKIVKNTKITPVLIFKKLADIPKRRHKKIRYIGLDQINLVKHAEELSKIVKDQKEATKILQNKTNFCIWLLFKKRINIVIVGPTIEPMEKKLLKLLDKSLQQHVFLISKNSTSDNVVELIYTSVIKTQKKD